MESYSKRIYYVEKNEKFDFVINCFDCFNMKMLSAYIRHSYKHRFCKREYSMCKITCRDILWLSNEYIRDMDIQKNQVIQDMNSAYDLELRQITLTNSLYQTNSFTESLYMMYKYLKCDLWGTPNHEVFMGDYFNKSHLILTELCLRGVYPIHGCEPSKFTRSCFDFIITVKDGDAFNALVDLLQNLFERGVNVAARRVKTFKTIQEIIFAADAGRFIYTDNFSKSMSRCSIGNGKLNGFHSKGHSSLADYDFVYTNSVDIEFGLGGIKPFSDASDRALEEELAKTHSLMYIELWSQTHDPMRVEDVFLQFWLSYNSIYGQENKV